MAKLIVSTQLSGWGRLCPDLSSRGSVPKPR